MRRVVFGFTTVLLGILVLTTGCTTKRRHQRDIANLQTQIGTLQSDVARLDQALRDSELALKAVQERGISPTLAKGSGSILAELNSGAIYRTPSGFELPVVAIQQSLKNAGYYHGTVDGKVGTRTKEAIRSFQRDQGLVTDGICGRQTWARLQKFA